jgi:hypothetical protein
MSAETARSSWLRNVLFTGSSCIHRFNQGAAVDPPYTRKVCTRKSAVLHGIMSSALRDC